MSSNMLPTTFLRVCSIILPSLREEVVIRTNHRKQIRVQLHQAGASDVIASLDRCEKSHIWIVFALAFLGLAVGWMTRAPVLAIIGAMSGAAVGSILSGIMVDNVYRLSEMVRRLDPSRE